MAIFVFVDLVLEFSLGLALDDSLSVLDDVDAGVSKCK